MRPTSLLATLRSTSRPTLILASSASVLGLSYLALRPAFKIGNSSSRTMSSSDFPKGKSEPEWQAMLNPEQFRILRGKGTEMAGSGALDSHYPGEGTYECAGCSTPLYTADTKFKSGCGWPSFFDSIPGAVTEVVDNAYGMRRVEIVCTACGGHLGHVFRGEKFGNPKDERACVNSVSIRYNPEEAAALDAALKAKS